MVVLSGAHTIGGKGFGSPIVFDNTYFKVLLEKPQTSSSKCMPLLIVSILFLSPLDFREDLSIITHLMFMLNHQNLLCGLIVFLCEAGMAAMVGLRTDWALTEDDECLR